MIARIWRGVVPTEKATQYLDYLQQTGVPDYRATPGNLSVAILQREVEQGTEFTTLTYWSDMASIRAFAGENPSIARYYPADDEFLLWREPFVEHFDVPYTSLESMFGNT